MYCAPFLRNVYTYWSRSCCCETFLLWVLRCDVLRPSRQNLPIKSHFLAFSLLIWRPWEKNRILLKLTRPVLHPTKNLVGNERWFLLNLCRSLTQEKNGADTVNLNVMSNLNSVHSCRRNLLGNSERDAYSIMKCHRTTIGISNFIIIWYDDYWLLIEIKVAHHLFATDFMWNYFRRSPFCSV